MRIERASAHQIDARGGAVAAFKGDYAEARDGIGAGRVDRASLPEEARRARAVAEQIGLIGVGNNVAFRERRQPRGRLEIGERSAQPGSLLRAPGTFLQAVSLAKRPICQ